MNEEAWVVVCWGSDGLYVLGTYGSRHEAEIRRRNRSPGIMSAVVKVESAYEDHPEG